MTDRTFDTVDGRGVESANARETHHPLPGRRRRPRREGTKVSLARRRRRPVEQAERYDREGADELVFLDITASSDRREIVMHMVRDVADRVFIPFTVGGGIRTVDDMSAILGSGADKVSINTAAIETPALITDGARR